MNFTTDTLKPIKFQSTSYRYSVNPLFEHIKITPQPEPYKKTKILRSPELSFNPAYNEIHEKIAEGNLQNNIKEAYTNIDYVPISTGYRGYSPLSSNTRKIGVKESFRDQATQVTSVSLSKETPQKAQKVAEILKENTPLENPFKTSDKNVSDSGSNYTPSPATEQVSKVGRGAIFKKLNKVRQQALQTKESSRKTAAYVRQRGTGYMPGSFKTPPTIKEEDEM